MNTQKMNARNTLMVAHRGLSGLELENTNAAFVAAGNRSYWGIETDVHRTSDGKFIIIHDDNTKRVSGGVSMVVEETDFDTLRALKLIDHDGNARTDLSLPSLVEYIRICKNYDKVCILELKNAMSEEDILHIIQEIETESYLGRVIFISFCFDNLVAVRKFRPAQTVQFLFGTPTEEILQKVTEHRFDVDVYYPELTPEWISRFHDAGLRINCWTVNDPAHGERLTSLGVDFITTNILEG